MFVLTSSVPRCSAIKYPALSGAFVFPPSRDAHTPAAHTYMVLVQLISSHLIYIPSVLWFLSKRLSDRGRRTKAIVALTVLGQPALLLADYGLGGWQSISLGLVTLSLTMLHTSLPNADPSALVGATKARAQIINLSRKVSYSYVAAITVFLWALSFDQSALILAPVVLALFLGRWAGLTSISASRGYVVA